MNSHVSFPAARRQATLARATRALEERARPDGHWRFDLESDVTIPAEYLLLRRHLGEVDEALEGRLAAYVRRVRTPGAGWAIHSGGGTDVSATVKAYMALKAAGDGADEPHMAEARQAVLAAGGAETCNVFTRIQLALYGEAPWDSVPAMPPEVAFLPARAPLSLWDMSYWSRTVVVPLLVVRALRPRARASAGVRELFREDPARVGRWGGPTRPGAWAATFRAVDALLRLLDPAVPGFVRRRALAACVGFVDARLEGDHGIGGIYPAIAYALVMYDALGVPRDDPRPASQRRALEAMLAEGGPGETYCQSCLSPTWDTALAAHAVLAAAEAGCGDGDGARRACEWLASRQVVDVAGDWAARRRGVRPGGWAFQYRNDRYPDVDDTAVVGALLHAVDPARYREATSRAREWIVGMQGRDGGWGAFDADNDRLVLNEVPFADHGALLDPSTADVTARCVWFLAEVGEPSDADAVARGLAFLRREQEGSGSWFGRWGTNHVYGTWSALAAMEAAGVPRDDPAVRGAASFLASVRNADGGWGEEQSGYASGRHEPRPSTPSQTAWALLGLLAAGEGEGAAAADAVEYLSRTQGRDGTWREDVHNAPGFPRVFYLRYDGYRTYFPLLALARHATASARAGDAQRGAAAGPPRASAISTSPSEMRAAASTAA